jgi:hypothetical protein
VLFDAASGLLVSRFATTSLTTDVQADEHSLMSDARCWAVRSTARTAIRFEGLDGD